MKKELVSIIIPIYNRAHLIEETLDSIIRQTYLNWECILVDDGSTDNTLEVLKNYNENDNRIKYYRRPSDRLKGANTCRNYGFELSKGEYINWFDSDDIMFENFIEDKISNFQNNIDAVVHRNKYSNYAITRFRKSKFYYTNGKNIFFHYAMEEVELQTSSFMWRSLFLKGKELFNPHINRYQDNEFHIRMLYRSPNLFFNEEELAIVRGGDGDSSQISSLQNLSTKKLLDIFYFRWLTIYLNKKNENFNYNEINTVISKKAIWSFYELLLFETKFTKRIESIIRNREKIIFIYLLKEFSFINVMKSVIYIFYILLFKQKKYNQK